MIENTIEKVTIAELCTGCGTCRAVCPFDAIRMEKGKKGIYLPKLNEKCTKCGLCLEACPGYEVDFDWLNLEFFGRKSKNSILGNYLRCYTGYATDFRLRYNSSSGGIVTALLLCAIEEGMIDGALVTKMDEKNPLKPKPFIARSKEEIVSAVGSKYCPVPANIALKNIIEEKGRYAVVGLPCHIQGIRKAEMINEELRKRIRLHIGIFCGGLPSFLATEFLLKKLGSTKDEVRRIEYRGGGWPGRMLIQLRRNASDSKLVIPYPQYLARARWRYFLPVRCKLCTDGVNELADISCGDAWLPEFRKDRIGTSIVIARNEIAERFLQTASTKGWIRLKPTSPDKVAESQQSNLWHKKNKIKTFFYFMKSLQKSSPYYNPIIMPETTTTNYLRNLLFQLGSFLASKRNLWSLFEAYSTLMSLIGVE